MSRLRCILACVVRIAVKHEAMVRMITYSAGWRKRVLDQSSDEQLKKKLFNVLWHCSIETLCMLEKYNFFNSISLSNIIMDVFECRNISNDPRLSGFKKRHRKYFIFFNIYFEFFFIFAFA